MSRNKRRPASGRVRRHREQARCRRPGNMTRHTFDREFERAAALLFAGHHRGTDPLKPSPARFAPSSLSHSPMDCHEADRLLSQMVRGTDRRGTDDAQVILEKPIETFRHVRRMSGIRRLHRGVPNDPIANPLQGLPKRRFVCELISTGNRLEKLWKMFADTVSVGPGLVFGVRAEKLDVTDQVGDANCSFTFSSSHMKLW